MDIVALLLLSTNNFIVMIMINASVYLLSKISQGKIVKQKYDKILLLLCKCAALALADVMPTLHQRSKP